MVNPGSQQCSTSVEDTGQAGTVHIIQLLRSAATLKLPLSREGSLALLGWVHSLILASLVVFVGIGRFSPLVLWAYPLALANAAILLFFTLPLTRTGPQLPGRKLWAIGIALVYVALSSILGSFRFNASPSGWSAFYHLRMGLGPGGEATYGYAAGLVPLLSLVALVVLLTLLIGVKRCPSRGSAAAVAWVLLGGAAVAGIWNQEAFDIPLYLLIGLGAYYFSAVFGSAGFVRLLVMCTGLLVWPSLAILQDWCVKAGGLPRVDWAHFQGPIGLLPGSEPWLTATWATPLPAVATAVAISARRRWAKAGLIAVALLTVLAAVAPMRRSAMISLGLMLPIALFTARPRWRLYLAGAFVPVAVIGATLYLTGIWDVWGHPGSDRSHLECLRVALWSFAQWPWFGIGFGHYYWAHVAYIMAHNPGLPGWWVPGHAHSTYLQLIMDAGIVGTLVIVLGTWQLFLRTRETYRATDDARVRTLILGIVVGLLGFLGGTGMFLSDLGHREIAGPYAIFFGAILGLAIYRRSPASIAVTANGHAEDAGRSGGVWPLSRCCWRVLRALALLGGVALIVAVLLSPSGAIKMQAITEREMYQDLQVMAAIDERIQQAGSDPEKAATALLQKARVACAFGYLTEAEAACKELAEKYPRSPECQEAMDLESRNLREFKDATAQQLPSDLATCCHMTETDPCDNFRHVLDRSANLTIDSSMPWFYWGDTGRIARAGSQAAEWVCYGAANKRCFEVTAYFFRSEPVVHFKFYRATSYSDWTEITPIHTTTVGRRYKIVYQYSDLPETNNYVKIVWPDSNGSSDSPQPIYRQPQIGACSWGSPISDRPPVLGLGEQAHGKAEDTVKGIQ